MYSTRIAQMSAKLISFTITHIYIFHSYIPVVGEAGASCHAGKLSQWLYISNYKVIVY